MSSASIPSDKDNFFKDVFMSEEQCNTLVSLLKNNKNLILQGPPGVGKTFIAKRLAYSLMGIEDDSKIQFIQFHQSYSYEDFIRGYKPNDKGGFELKDGVFLDFCKKAKDDPDNKYFFIIDEINRGNMSKIFGEVLMLIEKDKRGKKEYAVKLVYQKQKDETKATEEKFSVPENVHIIGMMNTADRSLAIIDYALRRRFCFYDMEPAFNYERFQAYKNELKNKTFNNLIEEIIDLNKEIEKDPSLGKGFCIGYSYFSGWQKENENAGEKKDKDDENDERPECTVKNMMSIVTYEIIPLLDEYWFDNDKKGTGDIKEDTKTDASSSNNEKDKEENKSWKDTYRTRFKKLGLLK